jgi:hypothetical protein
MAARVGGFILGELPLEEGQARTELRKLFQLDWSRKSSLFIGNIVGAEEKILNSRDAISSAANAVMLKLGYRKVGEHKNVDYVLNSQH